MPPKSKRPEPPHNSEVQEADESKWIWEQENALFGGGGGAVARLFKAEQFDKPGVLDIDPPTNEAALFARETIQNSWDAAREWRRACDKRGKTIPPFEINFEFIEIPSEQRLKLIYAMGLDEHSRVLEMEQGRERAKRQDFDLADKKLLTNIVSNKVPLRVLRVVERAGMGMPGNFERNQSRMTRALLRVGRANDDVGAGGAFGFGKAGLIQASASRIIFAYSAFQEVADDPGITRRFMGVTYWKDHKRGSLSLTGWARFGEPVNLKLTGESGETSISSARPYVNEVADGYAAQLGLDVRSPADDRRTGTTFLIVDPTITASELKKAIERYWWPAMLNPLETLRVRIRDYDGSDASPIVPHGDEHMAPLVRAYQIATSKTPPQGENEQRVDFGDVRGSDGNLYELGSLALIADPSGWSFPDKAAGGEIVEHRSMVALVRGPRMVVNYRTFAKLGTPHVRGVFIADQDVDDLLRLTENPTHTKWDPDVRLPDSPAPSIAKAVGEEVRAALIEFQRKFAPPAPKPDSRSLPVLEELSRLMRGKRMIPPTPEPRQVHISLTEAAHTETYGDALKCKARVRFRVADWVWDKISETVVKVQVSLSIAYVEDGGRGGDLKITATPSNPGFTATGAKSGKTVFHGLLGKGDEVEFSVASETYSPDWTVRFTPAAEITEPQVKPTRPKKPKGKA